MILPGSSPSCLQLVTESFLNWFGIHFWASFSYVALTCLYLNLYKLLASKHCAVKDFIVLLPIV